MTRTTDPTDLDLTADLLAGRVTLDVALATVDAAAATIPDTAYHPLFGSRPDGTRRAVAAHARRRIAPFFGVVRQLEAVMGTADYATGIRWVDEVARGEASHILASGSLYQTADRTRRDHAVYARRLGAAIRRAMTGR